MAAAAADVGAGGSMRAAVYHAFHGPIRVEARPASTRCSVFF